MSVTDAEVRALFPNDSGDADVTGYLQDANTLVTELLGSSSLSSYRLDMITKYLAAHFYTLAEHEGGIFEEKIGESSEKRGSTFTLGQGLKLTRFGQMVMSFDTTGTLVNSMGLSSSDKKSALFRLV